MLFLKARRGVEVTTFVMPEPATTANIQAVYEDILRRTPQAKMMLVTPLCHRTGLVKSGERDYLVSTAARRFPHFRYCAGHRSDARGHQRNRRRLCRFQLAQMDGRTAHYIDARKIYGEMRYRVHF
jgi:hypothetical protein